ncbi:hypothetical protein AAGR22_05695 [Erwinia sp. HDF1-3R]|uniref:hypothetical protein n=1 Tax=Erwinia sp. HDF1-3R TaxID=3141543 RepID=UPI0031F570B4
MPFNINSCLCNSTLSIDSFVDTSSTSKNSTQNIHSSGGYVTTSTNVKASDIKPRCSSLHPKLRMSAEEYTHFKELMASVGESNKKVHFDDVPSRKQSASHDVSDTHKPLTAPISTVDDNDTDFVPFEEFEQWRLQRLKDQLSTTPSDSDAIPASKQSERSAFSVEHAISTNYDNPREQAIPITYDFPRKQAISINEDIPIKK